MQFDNDADHRRAIADLQPLGVLLDSLVQNNTPRAGAAPSQGYLALLQMRARFNWMGYNLDQAGYAEHAEADYARLLALAPAAAKPAVQGEFGNFLASSARMERAIPMLRAAYQAGHKESGRDLATTLLTQNKRSEALRRCCANMCATSRKTKKAGPSSMRWNRAGWKRTRCIRAICSVCLSSIGVKIALPI